MTATQKILHTSASRGTAHHGWLSSRHTFSFAGYYNPERMNFGALRVLNDDTVSAREGFDTHPHRDMEIVSIPLSGSLKHEDSEGHRHVIRAGEIQIMSAGTGIAHSEYNASSDEEVKFLQIWVLPKKLRIEPRYGQKLFPEDGRRGRFQTLVSPDGRDGSLSINQDAFFSMADLAPGEETTYERKNPESGLYLFLIDGEIEAADEKLGPRDALGLVGAERVTVRAGKTSKVLLIEVPMRVS